MKKHLRWAIAAAAVCIVGVAVVVTSTNRMNRGDCYPSQSCLPSYNNTVICDSLQPGVSRADLVRKLGQPMRVDGNSMFFEPGATERGPIKVELDASGMAKKYYCRGE